MNIYDFTVEKLEDYLKSKDEKPFRAIQIFEWLYRFKVTDFSLMTNIKKSFLEEMQKDFSLNLLNCVVKQESSDGTIKFLFELEDKNLIETVLMKHDYGYSVCVTTQAGCNMGCKFCASGIKKKIRNLAVCEMVLQVLTVSVLSNIRVSHVVVMGIGEPFDNYDNVIDFLHIINNPHGLEIGARHISVSTCGLIPMIDKYATLDIQANLAISLHASNDEIRNELMPINKTYSIKKLIDSIKKYIEITNSRVTIEYILLDGVNDSIKNANELADLLMGMNVYVNLIPYNEVKEQPYKRSSKENMHKFYDALKKRGLNVTSRREQGFDIDAACGQLRSNKLEK